MRSPLTRAGLTLIPIGLILLLLGYCVPTLPTTSTPTVHGSVTPTTLPITSTPAVLGAMYSGDVHIPSRKVLGKSDKLTSSGIPLKGVGGGGLTVDGEVMIVVTKLPFKVIAPEFADLYFWRLPSTWDGVDDKGILVVTKAPEGKGTVSLQTLVTDWEKKQNVTKSYSLAINVGKVKPGPIDPIDPIDPVDPIDPKPKPAPIPVDGYVVLIVEETGQRGKLPASQLLILFDKRVRTYLDATCTKDFGGTNTKAWRIWDKDIDTSKLHKHWKDAMSRSRTSLPWILISHGAKSKGFEGPLPNTVDETLTLLRRYE